MSPSTQPERRVASTTAVICSPEDVVTMAAEAQLLKSRYGELRRISCEFCEGILTLRGRVSTYYLKQIAQELTRRLQGVLAVDNQLEVTTSPGRPRAGEQRWR